MTKKWRYKISAVGILSLNYHAISE